MDKLKALQAEHFPKCKPLPGARDLLETLHKTSNPHVHLALASSSHKNNYEIKTQAMRDMFTVFPEANVVLGDDPRVPKGRGKPAPDIYVLALKTINDELKKTGNEKEILPEECLVIEDSVPGVEAGRRAGMQVLWCPYDELLAEYQDKEKEVLAGLTGEFEEVAPPEGSVATYTDGKPSQIDDGWAVRVRSLEDFPYKTFGINV